MELKHIYLALCILGVILPYSQLVPFMLDYGVDMALLFQMQFANSATSFFGFDLLLTVFASLVLIISEGKKLKMDNYWIPIAGIFLIGAAFGVPLFLYMRELKLERKRGK